MSARRVGVALPRAILREARRQVVSRTVAGERADAHALRGLLRDSSPRGCVEIGVRALGGRRVVLRSGTTDAHVAIATFSGRYHLPPSPLPAVRRIWDIGANVGLTTAHFAECYRDAQIIGIEPHPENFAVAQRNIAGYESRCVLLQSAAWTHDGEVTLAGEAGPEDGYHVSPMLTHDRVAAVSLNTLLARRGRPDYVKLDVEGGERQLLNEATDWALCVRCISVECHSPYRLGDCVADLERLGFDTLALPQTLRRRARDCAVGLRRLDGV